MFLISNFDCELVIFHVFLTFFFRFKKCFTVFFFFGFKEEKLRRSKTIFLLYFWKILFLFKNHFSKTFFQRILEIRSHFLNTFYKKKHNKCLRGGLNPPKGPSFECLRGGFALLQGALVVGNFNKEIKGLELGLSITMP